MSSSFKPSLTSSASSSIKPGVICGPGSLEKLRISKSAYLSRPGTLVRICSPESTGTAAPTTGSICIEIVPPVKTSNTLGFFITLSLKRIC